MDLTMCDKAIQELRAQLEHLITHSIKQLDAGMSGWAEAEYKYIVQEGKSLYTWVSDDYKKTFATNDLSFQHFPRVLAKYTEYAQNVNTKVKSRGAYDFQVHLGSYLTALALGFSM